ncbi:anti-sigma factor domain-containing protein [Spongiimicrobium sp. 3-5]|uniref:anti-sigma factor n=1 Tax=Spongiimicrobium sp. 3-5 TaxID=3332596 RepID=UPI0039802CD2
MDVKKYIASGILELYVAGTLSDEENLEIYHLANEHPEIRKEIEQIEAAILAMSAASYSGTTNFEKLKSRLNETKSSKALTLPGNKINWKIYSGWAAAALFAAGMLWFYSDNKELKSNIDVVTQENAVMEEQILEARNSLEDSEKLLNTLRDKNIAVIPLAGQDISPNAYAKAFWNKQEKKVFIDAQGLPAPPKGKVYQVWSLKLDPFSPTSIGLLENFDLNGNKVFALLNENESEAFGITLEPAGGSEVPNLEQLYALGATTS